MEKFTIRSAYSEVSLYARWTMAPGRSKPADGSNPVRPDDGAAEAKPQSPENAVTARNADGDTFTLSIEARAIQVSETVCIGTGSAGGKTEGALDAARAGRIGALREALERNPGHGGRRHRYPELADAADVAARAAEEWDREYARRPGSRRDFAAGIRSGLDRWMAGEGASRPRAEEYRVFRSEVAVEISARLETWTGSAEPEAQDLAGPGSG